MSIRGIEGKHSSILMGVFLCKIFERGGQNVCCCNQRKRKSRRTDVKRYISYPKRDPIQNYFPLPNEIYILGLTAGEIAVYGYLLYCENRKTYQCYPSYKTIGRAISMSKRYSFKICADTGGQRFHFDRADLYRPPTDGQKGISTTYGKTQSHGHQGCPRLGRTGTAYS